MLTENSNVSSDEQRHTIHSELVWEQTFNAVSEMIYIIDRDCTIVSVNRAMADRYNCATKDLVGRKCFDVIHDLASMPDYCPHARLLETLDSQVVELEIEKLHEIFEITMTPILDAEGQLMASVHVARNVTEKRRIERALQESEQRFSVFMEHLPLAVTIKDENGKIQFANEYMKDLLGVDTLIGLSGKDLFPPDTALKIANEDQEALNRGLGLYKDTVSDNDGYELIFDTYKFPITFMDGTKLLGTISQDVTEKRRHEEQLEAQQIQLEEINSSLESRIAETVAELRQKDNIIIQQSRLSSMSEMISNIAHQWRQPLNNIGLIVQSLQLAFKSNELTVQELDEDIADTMRVLQQISETIDDFRNFFSCEDEATPFVLNELVSRALSFISPSFKSKGIRIELVEQPDVTVEGYPNAFVQAILNILLNARDALMEHKVENPLVSINIFKDNGHCVVTIHDNGGGIDEDVLPKIFDPYFTTKGQKTGTGIGLYMAKMIVEKNMNGHLTARNLNHGAEFKIEI